MRLDHEFTIPVPAARAWPVLLDIERIAPCLPGATITRVEGTDFEGKVKVKVGPITVTYTGQASFTDIDDATTRAVIKARGKEARGSGTANATITAQLHDEGETTRVTVRTDLAITGRPAQFGRGVLVDVGAKLLGRFATNLAEQLSVAEIGEAKTAPATGADADADGGPTPPTGTSSVRAAQATRPGSHQPDDAIDLLAAAGLPVLKRVGPILAGVGLVLTVLVIWLRRQRR
ncbi:MAG: SRPBCC family protein [Actinobacteria bacterium]|nr:SRPBCC family protein [Actinomycetota bacterium]